MFDRIYWPALDACMISYALTMVAWDADIRINGPEFMGPFYFWGTPTLYGAMPIFVAAILARLWREDAPNRVL